MPENEKVAKATNAAKESDELDLDQLDMVSGGLEPKRVEHAKKANASTSVPADPRGSK